MVRKFENLSTNVGMSKRIGIFSRDVPARNGFEVSTVFPRFVYHVYVFVIVYSPVNLFDVSPAFKSL